jgi:heme oxygenase
MNFQERLKSETKQLHDEAENHPFHTSLMSGKLPDLKYFVYLHNIFPIFSYLERRMNLSGELVRSPLIHTDIMRYSKDGSVIEGKDLNYFDWIIEIGKMPDSMLPAILYVEWLKDAYGGQMISKYIKYNAHLSFNNAKSVIGSIRTQVGDIKEEDQDQFIAEVNNVYKNHTRLLDKIMK